MVPINYLAVIVSTIVMMGLGALWYGPFFGKQWQKLMGFTEESMKTAKAKGMAKSYGLMAVGALIMSFVLSHSLVFATTYLGTSGIAAGIQAGFWNWLGFIVPVSMGSVIWEGKPWKLWFINAGYYLVGLILIGILLALWM
ncbi:DUF1761 domain-containing protein [Candidatus Kaiserbacteria bacterium CG10_big_fil_rev_8_21_14_0_10_51_14]|uniref:DUF1761 domain-containing protein n=1 Tax=Candidatus Kaiserbacteria bacterium CG10_big_fil_rev_8_21_14_0_10_51_14 TaxID=1974610 RepID=A0A2H0UEC5_9BACT|nr:MAG: DUF1761 domain-containing protein [Candidatus Kaiserbacteria bacterium CG10_big_fil_rev_8_21_14_0_10_51_14]